MRTYVVQVYDKGEVTPIRIQAESTDEACRRVEAGLTSGRVLSVIIPREDGA